LTTDQKYYLSSSGTNVTSPLEMEEDCQPFGQVGLVLDSYEYAQLKTDLEPCMIIT